MSTVKQVLKVSPISLESQRSYSEIVQYLDFNWSVSCENRTGHDRLKQLDNAFSGNFEKLNLIFVSGSNGKSLTTHFASRLLKEEGFSVGAFSSPSILTYNERFTLDNEIISNKQFTDIANEVINMAEKINLKANTYELLAQMAANYFVSCKVGVVIMELNQGGLENQLSIFNPKIVAITRLVSNLPNENVSYDVLKSHLEYVKEGSYIICADQNKEHLKFMAEFATNKKLLWQMPIRKSVALEYPFEQLHGRCASLAERISSLFINNFTDKENSILSESILSKKEGKRGRPTLETKRILELNPKKTIEHFWKDTLSTLPARFQLFDKEKPSVLVDIANNNDSFENLLLGIRLINYQKPIKGLVLIIGCHKNSVDVKELAKQIRYFLKKMTGNVILCKTPDNLELKQESWDLENALNKFNDLKVKAKISTSLKDAVDQAKKSVNERNGLIVIAGSATLIQEYWNQKGIKKF